jgi:hypothetical protein
MYFSNFFIVENNILHWKKFKKYFSKFLCIGKKVFPEGEKEY